MELEVPSLEPLAHVGALVAGIGNWVLKKFYCFDIGGGLLPPPICDIIISDKIKQ